MSQVCKKRRTCDTFFPLTPFLRVTCKKSPRYPHPGAPKSKCFIIFAGV